MIERVVVPVDFSPESERAAAMAAVLAERAGVHVELVSAVAPIDRVDVEAALAALAEHAGRGTTWRVLESGGPVEATLITELHRHEEDLWCVGSHARGALGEMLVGSLSEDLVRDAHAPVVLVGPHVVGAPSGDVLVVTVDGTNVSEAVLPTAVRLADSLGMTVRILQVGDRGSAGMRSDAQETGYVHAVATRMPTIEKSTLDYDVLHGGHVARELADYLLVHVDVGMVAMATRGLRGGARLRHGSTAFELAHRGPVPVAVLHHA